jgi:hypothetical protein
VDAHPDAVRCALLSALFATKEVRCICEVSSPTPFRSDPYRSISGVLQLAKVCDI